MFYLQTKDGEKFLTNTDSDDRAEFGRIIENKLGQSAFELYNDIVDSAAEDVHDILVHLRNRYDTCVQALDKALNDKEIDRVKLEEILSDLEAVYLDLRELTS